MSSTESRIWIEHYENGGFGVFIDDKDHMGLWKKDVLPLIEKWLSTRK